MGKFRVCVAGMVTSAGCIGLGLRFFEVGFRVCSRLGLVNLFRLGFDFLLGWFRVYVGLVSGWLSWGFSRVGGCSLGLLSSLSGVGLISITTAVFGVEFAFI